MISDKNKKIQQIKKIQKDNIHKALMTEHKLDRLKDKSKNLELKAKLFLKSNEQIKQKRVNLKKKWQFILIGGILLGLGSVLLGLAWPYCLFNTLSGGLIAYALSETADFIKNIDLSDLPNPNLPNLMEIEKIEQEAVPKKRYQNLPQKLPTPIHPTFDEMTKKIDLFQVEPKNKNSYAFKK